MQATARMASVVSSPLPARRRLIRGVRPTNTPLAMRLFSIATLALLVSTAAAGAVELQRIEHKTIHDERTFVRDAVDRRYSIWTDDQAKATAAMKELGFGVVPFELKPGQILAVFFNDNITEDLVQIEHNKATRSTFAVYADSGMRFKLRRPEVGKKYSHATVVIFTPIGIPSHLGLRAMAQGGLSDKK